ncbi:putative arabinose efflux permease, MFS family [Streptoalloteichus tenebrarius]|uniref:Arabinose efflux permease, MFS family n=1 Tax=Streptoalloteichus tenebrarius (strain ATCC 17920 / DSM 40477 / JCM 4838 / CBS 697.72 / NBRC 16177 / NCIMB 11028 / NRRL B-12390 / A12253. 1 / ISP 5477) TaxID=1933 RepID=A0ABT1HNM9_STRSD|nr:MFS transporter [Streptoalloteichus tenebrarius]MCP2257114.1 putative arabinose efflux permease, MFS family [Streptoalloteichus tenebrarius]BFE98746.1 MFS transporter [Streptoalloteichus tenebrarius]
MTATSAPLGLSTRSFWLLRAAGLISNFDRFSIGPMLVLIGAQWNVPLSTVALAASAYFLCYGLMQPVWGVASDRLGRIWVLRRSLAGAALAAIVSAAVPTVTAMVVARAVAGAFFAAAISSTLTYVGDTVPVGARQRYLSDLMTMFALGTALATLVAGALADAVSWRLVFLLPGLVAAYLAVALRRLPEPEREPLTSWVAPMRVALRSRWQWYVMGVAFVEGMVLLGLLTYLAPAMQSRGVPSTVAGAVSALYGVGAMLSARIVRRVAGALGPVVLIVVGGTLAVLAYTTAAVSLSTPSLVITALLLGGGWSFLHSTIQSWATELVPAARATGIALFGVSLYGGSAFASALAADSAARGLYSSLFLIGAVLLVPLTAAAALGRARHRR